MLESADRGGLEFIQENQMHLLKRQITQKCTLIKGVVLLQNENEIHLRRM